MTDSDIKSAIASQRRELAELLGHLPATSWDAPTLCDGWRVREVVAHITMPFRYSAPRFAVEVIKARGSFNRMADRCARRDAALPSDQLLAALRDNEANPWKPPGGGFEGALTHDVIHGLDICVPLDSGRRLPEPHLRIVLETITKPKSLKFFGVDLGGIELRANDMDWSYGSGVPVSGEAQHLALVLCGRKLPAGLLQGEPSPQFTRT